MAESCLLSAPSSLFYNKTKHLFFSAPSRPLKLQLSSINPSPALSLAATTHHRSSAPLFVAQTSDWAQQEEDNTLTLEDQEEGAEGVSETEAGWEPNGEDAEIEGAEEGEGEEGDYEEPPEEAKLFVGNLPYDADGHKLAELFNQVGTVDLAEVIYNRETDQSRGFGFVTMKTVEDAEKAVDKLNGYDFGGRLLTVNKAAPRGSRPERAPRSFDAQPAFRVYVGNLPWDFDNSQLEQVFSEHGKVVSARVVYDRETGRSRGFGFVTMSDEAELNDAIAALDGQSLGGRTIRVNVAEDRPRRSFWVVP